MRIRRITVVAASLVLWIGTAASAYAVGYATDDRGRLFEIRPRKQLSKLLGTVKVKFGTTWVTPTLTDLALSAKHGMYGISYTELYKINMADPTKSTRVGLLGGESLNALAFDEDDALWATGGSSLYRVNLLTGRATRVGSFGGVGSSDGDLAFVGKTLYATLSGVGGTHLATLDPKTGRATSVGLIRTTTKQPVYSVWGLIWDGQRMFALTSDGRVFRLDEKRAIATPLFTARNRFWGACPMLRL